MYEIKKQDGDAIIDYLLKSLLPSSEVQKIAQIFKDSYKEDLPVESPSEPVK
jgi:hypothetical protein